MGGASGTGDLSRTSGLKKSSRSEQVSSSGKDITGKKGECGENCHCRPSRRKGYRKGMSF